MIALIGIILLIGIVKKNGIMLVDFALEQERQHGLSPERAVLEAARERFRPILMTTFAALLGAVPLAIGVGPGSELRRPLGIAIIGGLLVSQVLTLYTTPIIYLLLDKLHRRLGGARRPSPRRRRAGGVRWIAGAYLPDIDLLNSAASWLALVAATPDCLSNSSYRLTRAWRSSPAAAAWRRCA